MFSTAAVNPPAYLIRLEDKPSAALLAASVRDFLLRAPDVCAITGLSVPTIYRLMSRGKFPRPLKITRTARAWRLTEITAWVDSRDRETPSTGLTRGAVSSNDE
jgi:prophage regulatory protein